MRLSTIFLCAAVCFLLVSVKSDDNAAAPASSSGQNSNEGSPASPDESHPASASQSAESDAKNDDELNDWYGNQISQMNLE